MFRKMLVAAAAVAGVLAFAASSAVDARPPRGPGFHRPPPPIGAGPGFHRPSPPRPGWHRPPPPPRYHRVHHHDWYWWGPLAVGGAILGANILSDRLDEPRVEYVPVPVPAEPAASDKPIWYWCASEKAYYPAVRSCPLGWTPILGTSSTTPPAPPGL